MQDYTTPTPDPALLQGLVLTPWHLSTALQHARGACCNPDEKTWPDVEARYGHRKNCHYCEGLRGAKIWPIPQRGGGRAQSQLAQALLGLWYAHQIARVQYVGDLGKWSHLVYTVVSQGHRIVWSKLVLRSHVPHASGTGLDAWRWWGFLPAAKMARER